jgi:hypothetical protein
MNPIVSTLYALLAVTLIAKDWFTFQSKSKLSWTVIVLQVAALLLFVCILLDIKISMPTKWLYKSFADTIEAWIRALTHPQ